MKYAIVTDNTVVNVIELDDANAWRPPEGCEIVAGEANIGDGWDGAQFVAPALPPAPTTPAQIKTEAQRRILSRFPAWKQINAALGVYDDAAISAMVDYINAVRLASDAIEARLANEPYLDPATAPEWPEVE